MSKKIAGSFDGSEVNFSEYGEFPGFNMLAVDLAGDVDSDSLYDFLDKFEALEKLSYAELCL